jgi:hypothetical protein
MGMPVYIAPKLAPAQFWHFAQVFAPCSNWEVYICKSLPYNLFALRCWIRQKNSSAPKEGHLFQQWTPQLCTAPIWSCTRPSNFLEFLGIWRLSSNLMWLGSISYNGAEVHFWSMQLGSGSKPMGYTWFWNRVGSTWLCFTLTWLYITWTGSTSLGPDSTSLGIGSGGFICTLHHSSLGPILCLKSPIHVPKLLIFCREALHVNHFFLTSKKGVLEWYHLMLWHLWWESVPNSQNILVIYGNAWKLTEAILEIS